MNEPMFIQKRNSFYKKVCGNGIEIGAFEHPARLPKNCNIIYCDVISADEARVLFPEINHDNMVAIDKIIDLDGEGLRSFKNSSQDFVIINHVIEHIFDPVYAIEECFRVLKSNGILIMSVPDNRFTFDKYRPLTSVDKIFTRIKRLPKVAIPEDYSDILDYIDPQDVLPEIRHKFIDQSENVRNELLNLFMKRREHINVWTDETFNDFVDEVLFKKKTKC